MFDAPWPSHPPSMFRLLLFALVAVPAVQAQTAPLFSFDSPTPAVGGGFGYAIETIGDLDGDGVPDVAVSSPDEDATLADGTVLVDVGQIHVFSGATGLRFRTYASPDPETDAFFPDALLAAGDQDGDGVDDFYASASREFVGDLGDAGRVYLMSGADGSAIRSFTAPTPVLNAEFGFALNRLGDLTGDGVGEIGVGSHLERVDGQAQAGRLYVLNGATEAVLFTLQAPDPQEQGVFGYTSDDAGDVDGDGVPDIVTGEPGRDVGPFDLAGRAYLFSGADGSLIRAVTSPSPNDAGGFGRWTVGLGDVDGDGVPDVATGGNGERPNDVFYGGRAYVLSGADGSAIQTLVSPDVQQIGFFGELVEAVGDQDGDGVADLAVSARAEDDDRIAEGGLIGRVYLFSSATGALLGTLKPPTADPDGTQYFGYGLSNLGDLDGDGRDEIGVGAFSEQPSGVPPTENANFGGRAYVFSGAQATPTEAPAPAEARTLSVVPNPARTAATLRLGAAARIVVADMLGRVVLRRDAAPGDTRLDVSGWAPGVYTVVARSGDTVVRTRFTVAR